MPVPHLLTNMVYTRIMAAYKPGLHKAPVHAALFFHFLYTKRELWLQFLILRIFYHTRFVTFR